MEPEFGSSERLSIRDFPVEPNGCAHFSRLDYDFSAIDRVAQTLDAFLADRSVGDSAARLHAE